MRVVFDQCDSTEEVCGLFNKIFANQELMEAKIVQNAKEIEALKSKPKKKGKTMKPGFAIERVLAILVLVAAIAGLCYAAYVPSDINYEIASNPELLTTYLRDVTGNMVSDSYLFTPRLGTNPPPLADGRVWYNNTANRLQISLDGLAWTNIDVSGGNSLDAAYDLSGAITVDGAAVTLTVPLAAANAALTLISNDTTSDPDVLIIDQNSDLATVTAIQIDSVTGYDIRGTADSWYVSYLGVATLPGIIVGGTDIVMENGGVINNTTDNEIEFIENAEEFSFAFNGNILTLATDTGINELAMGVVDDLTGVGTIEFDVAASSITLPSTGDAEDLTIEVTGATDSSLVLGSAGTGDDSIIAAATAGGIDIDAVKSIVITSTENTTDSIVLQSTLGGIQVLADAAGATEDILLSNTGGSVTVTASEDVTDAINIDATAGGIDIDAVGEAGQDIVITNTGGSVNIVATEAAALDAFNLDVTGAISGVDVDTTNGPIVLTAANATNGDITLAAADVMTFTSADTKIFDGAAAETWVIEGTADLHEATVVFTDPTADVTYTVPVMAADTVSFMLSTLATNAPDIANSVTGGTNQLIFEGAGVDAHEAIITATDPTADIIWTLPDGGADTVAFMASTLATNYPEIANSVTGGTNQLIFEGSDDAHETILTATDATADATLTLPDDTGYFAYIAEAGTTTKDATDASLPLTDAVVIGTSGAASAWSLPNGEEGQILTVVIGTDGGEATITPATAAGCGWATVVLTDDIDGVTFLYVNDTVGWIILGTFSDGTNIVEVTQ